MGLDDAVAYALAEIDSALADPTFASPERPRAAPADSNTGGRE
jgi:hypothetical protein